MDLPFFSIVIPTYNRAPLLVKAIESVIKQTFTDWEIIVVDDGSTDNTREVIAAISDKRIRYVYQENAERSVARNNGIKQSSGTYVCFLDSDDYYLSSRLQQLYDYLFPLNSPVYLFYTDKLQELNGQISPAPAPLNVSDNVYDQIITSVIHSQQVCAHRLVFHIHLFNPDFRISEDTELWLRIANDFKVEIIPQATVVIVEHKDRSINETSKDISLEMLNTLRYIFNKNHSGNKISKSVQQEILSNCFLSVAKRFIREKKYIRGLYFLGKSVCEHPSHPQTKYKLNIALKTMFPFWNEVELKRLINV